MSKNAITTTFNHTRSFHIISLRPHYSLLRGALHIPSLQFKMKLQTPYNVCDSYITVIIYNTFILKYLRNTSDISRLYPFVIEIHAAFAYMPFLRCEKRYVNCTINFTRNRAIYRTIRDLARTNSQQMAGPVHAY